MNIVRITALLRRHLFLYKRSVPRLMDLFFWPVMELFVWGFLSYYLQNLNLANINFVTVLLGGIVFWEFLNQSQRAVSVAFLEEVWEKNFLNIFITPLRISEFLCSTFILAAVRIVLIAIILGILSYVLYHFSLLGFGLVLIPSVVNLLLFGWILGLFTTGLILRYGTSAQVLAFGFIFLIQPFSAVFYPVSALPHSIQWISLLIPSTYVFEGMRMAATQGVVSLMDVGAGLVLNGIYACAVVVYFNAMIAWIKKEGRLLKLD